MHDVCAVVVSHNDKRRLGSALAGVLGHAGWLDLDVVVVDNGSDGSAEYVEENFVGVRTIRCPNRGLGHANNRAVETTNARYVLFLGPDTEILEGSLSAVVAALDRRPEVALAAVKHLRDDGSLVPSIRRFPSAMHMHAEALGLGRVPGVRRVLGERELDNREYDRERPCDWVSGSFMLVRQAALEDTGWFDERFFLFLEEADLCWRLKRAGWEIFHMPQMTICRHGNNRWKSARLEAQAAYARMQFARKHFPWAAADYRWALALSYAFRVCFYSLLRRYESGRRQAATSALATVLKGRAPFGEWSAL